jgi:hypothetical protein
MLSYTDEGGNFCAIIQPRMATAQEIHDAFAKIPGVQIGTFQGVKFTRR